MDAALGGARSAEIEAHVAECPECREVVDDVRRFEALVRAARDDRVIAIPTPRRRPRTLPAILAMAAMAALAVWAWWGALQEQDAPEASIAAEPAAPADEESRPAAREPSPTSEAPDPSTGTPARPAPRLPRVATPATTAPVATSAPTTAAPTAAPEVLAGRIVLSNTAAMQACYEEAINADPTLGGVRTEVTVSVAPAGTILGVVVRAGTPAVVRRCIESAVRAETFPASEEGLEVTVPLRFEMRASP